MDSREAYESVIDSANLPLVVKSEPIDSIDSVSAVDSSVPSASSSSNSRLETNDSSHCDASELRDFDAFCRFAFPENENSIQPDTSLPFYFESDHVALKGNDDYRRLVRAFVLLESQRTAALHDLDVLLELQQKALHDPFEFVSQMQHGHLKKQFPRPRQMAELPTVAWERYTDDVEAVLASLGGAAHSTRQKQKRELMSGIRDSSRMMSRTTTTTNNNRSVMETSKQRPSTFNQPWTVEEQRLLERLLQKYPSERFEARRFSKIAAELPGRTTQQVTSRVQKYFIKLAKAGLPVPGRMPNLAAYGGRWFNGRFHGYHQRHNHFYFPTSTFLTSYAPPVYMSDDDGDDDDGGTRGHIVSEMRGDDVPDCLRDSDEYRELKTLTALRQSMLFTPTPVSNQSSDERLVQAASVNASRSQNSVTQIDLDYTSDSTGISSYLDPNYLPAV